MCDFKKVIVKQIFKFYIEFNKIFISAYTALK